MTVKILVVDDSQMERVLIKGMLVKNPEYRVDLAEDGEQALRCIATSRPDLVITDLVMPEMDGLDLVRTMRQRHSRIPVVLMTAHGNESVVLDALEAGAASYVPKSRQAERLLETVDRVIKHASANLTGQQLGECVLDYHCRFALDNDLQLIRALVDQLQQVMTDQGFGDTIDRIRIGEALEESLQNAMYHGNLEIDEHELANARGELDDRALRRLVDLRCRDPHIGERKILVVAHLTPSEVRFVIRDQGRGFNTAPVRMDNAVRRLQRDRHRGLTLIQSLMDEVHYNETGNELTMKKCQRVPSLKK